jgi:formate hydrogenlyase subunit 6/NADH:ubiquinone oxidoreductase subunit I
MPGSRRSFVHLFPELIRTLLAPRVTVRYPAGPAQLPEGFRGRLKIRTELCVGCGLCVRDCPAQALELQREEMHRYWLLHHGDRCACCGQCVDSCRQGALNLVNELPGATSWRIGMTRVLVAAEGGED